MKRKNIGLKLIKIVSLLLVLAFSSCESNVEEDNVTLLEEEEAVCDPEISYLANVAPIFNTYCVDCHSGGTPPNLSTFNGISNNAIAIQGQVVSRAMPQGESLTNEQIQLIDCWVENGAIEN